VELAVQAQRAHGPQRFHERRCVGVWVLVAVPAAVGPLPVQQSFDEARGSVILEAQLDHAVQRVCLLRGTAAVPPFHDGYARAAVGLRLTRCLELGIELIPKPELGDSIAQCPQRGVTGRIADVRQRRQHPVGALPLRVRVDTGMQAAAVQQGSDSWRGPNLFLDCRDLA
jgi:hypothetical protein